MPREGCEACLMPVRVAFWIMCAFTVEPGVSGIVKQFVIVLVISLYGYVLVREVLTKK